jgi:hypothetical protein
MPRKKAKSKSDRTLQMVHPNAAAIDVGATLLMAAVRADRTADPVRSFGTFTTDLHRLVDWFAECGVDTVAMESTSVGVSCGPLLMPPPSFPAARNCQRTATRSFIGCALRTGRRRTLVLGTRLRGAVSRPSKPSRPSCRPV